MIDLTSFLVNLGLSVKLAGQLNTVILSALLLLVAYVSYRITRFFIGKVITTFFSRTENVYDDIIVQRRVFDNLAHIVPAIILIYGIKLIFHNETLAEFLVSVTYSYLVFELLIVLFRFLDALNDMYELYAEKRQINIHIKQYLQVLKVIFAIFAVIFVISIFLNRSPTSIIAGLGAMTAVLILVFKDSILSLVASIQISAYDLVKVGDWITIPSRGIDGDVIDISLNTIKIKNFDNTISTVPTYALVQESFQNWRGMVKSGGRRIKRAIYIDMNSIALCTPEMIEKFKNIHYISEYVSRKQEEIDRWNREHNIKEPVRVNGRAQTNIGVFRKYIENYIRSNFKVYMKFKKEEFRHDGVVEEKFVIPDLDRLVDFAGEKVKRYVSQLDGRYVIRDAEKFLKDFPDKFVLEGGYIYWIRKVKRIKIVRGAEVEIAEYEKIVEKEGRFRDDMTLLIRQLHPTEKGLPLEIYVFTATTNWVEYESIQSDLFDHIFAVLPEFGLRVFQIPSSNDVREFLMERNIGNKED